MARKEDNFYNQLAEIYKRKEMSRFELSDKYGVDAYILCSIFKRRGIEIWDLGNPKTRMNDEIAELYKNRQFTREELSQKFNVEFNSITRNLRNRKIPLWDRKISQGKPKTKLRINRFYNWRELILYSSYARMIFEYNK